MKPRMRAIAAAVVLLVTGCTAPALQYVSAGSYGMYFAMPASWRAVPARQLLKAQTGWSDDAGKVFQQSVRWQAAWTAGSANADDVYSATAPAKPVIFAFVRDLIGVEQQGVGSNMNSALHDIVIPASSIVSAGGSVETQQVRHGRFRGLHQFSTYATGGTLQSVEVVSMLAPGKNRLYVLSIRCDEQCFSKNIGTINAVFDSLTFKEPRGQ